MQNKILIVSQFFISSFLPGDLTLDPQHLWNCQGRRPNCHGHSVECRNQDWVISSHFYHQNLQQKLFKDVSLL